MSGNDDTTENFLDLLKAKDHLSDVSLRGTDGRQIPAVRFLLAARSSVFERMLYGDFAESTDRVVDVPYTGDVVERVVAYCLSGSLEIVLPNRFEYLPNDFRDCGERDARALVTLVAAAHFFELQAFENAALMKAGDLMKKSPPLACALYDEALSGAAKHDEMASKALVFIHETPRSVCGSNLSADANDDNMGAHFLRSDSIVNVIDGNLRTSELTKFRCLLAWFKKQHEGPLSEESRFLLDREENRLEVAQEVAKQIKLWLIAPSELNSTVQESGFVSKEELYHAYKVQALHAEEEGVQFVPEHVVVRGAGIDALNGKLSQGGE